NDRCQTFANTIPNTVTGNTLDFQATADFKDTVFANFPPVTNCGILTVTKRTVDTNGKTLADSNNPLFGYRVKRADSSAIRFDADVTFTTPTDCAANPNAPGHCVDGAPTQTQILRPNVNGGTALLGGQTQTHTDLKPGNNYQLIEISASAGTNYGYPSTYSEVNAMCSDGTGAAGASTTLSAAVTASATTISVASASGITPGTYGVYITIDSETLLVTGANGTTLTVERHQLGTTAAAHTSGAIVQVVTFHVVSTTVDQSSGLTALQIVIPDGVKQTDCVITNQFVKLNVSIDTAQRLKINDNVTVNLGAALQTGESTGNVT